MEGRLFKTRAYHSVAYQALVSFMKGPMKGPVAGACFQSKLSLRRHRASNVNGDALVLLVKLDKANEAGAWTCDFEVSTWRVDT